MEINDNFITLTNHDGGGFGLILDNVIAYSVGQGFYDTTKDKHYYITINTRYSDDTVALCNTHTVGTEEELRDRLKIINNALANALKNTLIKKLAAK